MSKTHFEHLIQTKEIAQMVMSHVEYTHLSANKHKLSTVTEVLFHSIADELTQSEEHVCTC